jgi:hypothetical protein
MAHGVNGTIGIAALLLACGATQVAVSQDTVPSDAELRTAYCIPVLQFEIKMVNDAQASADNWFKRNPPSTPELQKQIAETSEQGREEIARLNSTLSRLQAYLLPRFMQRDPVALAMATKRAQADLQELQANANRCVKQCATAPDNKACLESCGDPDLTVRLKSCIAPTWLPF